MGLTDAFASGDHANYPILLILLMVAVSAILPP